MFLTAIGGLVSAIIGLVIYIKYLHKKGNEIQKDNQKTIIELYDKSIVMSQRFIEAVNKTSDASEEVAGAVDRINITVNDLHKYILSQK